MRVEESRATAPPGPPCLRLAPDASFSFRCHEGIRCFNECCRELELALTPYDVLRLKNGLSLASGDFLDRYCVIENDGKGFPHVYLAMVDDGRASCPFVSNAGCRVYADRPGACRAYPVGRASFIAGDGSHGAFHILLQEPHCGGNLENTHWTATSWMENQGVAQYNSSNDECMAVLQHPMMRDGKSLHAEEIEKFLLALYNLDRFRQCLADGSLGMPPDLGSACNMAMKGEDQALLTFALAWLGRELFGNDLIP